MNKQVPSRIERILNEVPPEFLTNCLTHADKIYDEMTPTLKRMVTRSQYHLIYLENEYKKYQSEVRA